MMRTAISPRFAIRIRGFATRLSCLPAALRQPIIGAPERESTVVLSEDALRPRRSNESGGRAPVRVRGGYRLDAGDGARAGGRGRARVDARRCRAPDAKDGTARPHVARRARRCAAVLVRPAAALEPGSGGLAHAARRRGAGRGVARGRRPADARCKWPNDLLVAGRKAGGILAESRASRRDASSTSSSGSA